MTAYLDNAATTVVSDEVLKKIKTVYLDDFGNPSSRHHMGVEAEKYIKESKDIIAKILKCTESEIVFTSGGTESNNLALIGTALANKRNGNHIITTKMEHASVYNPILFLQNMGFDVTFINVDKQGHVDTEMLKNAIRPDTIIVSVMYVNNEIGSINNISEISKIVKKINPKTIFHVDAIQAFGKISVVPKNEGIDLLSVSGHKIHAPKGSGFLYIKKGTKIQPIIYGGGQEKGMRSGTENVPAISGLGCAAKEMYDNLEDNRKHLYELKERLVFGLLKNDDVYIHTIGGNDADENEIRENIYKTAPHIVSCGFGGIEKAESFLNALSDREVYVSSGSACSSNHPDISGTLSAIGTDKKYLQSTLRFSFSKYTTAEEIDYALLCIKEILPLMRKYRRH